MICPARVVVLPAAVLAVLGASKLEAAVWRVGPSRGYKAPSEVATLVADGDTVEIDAGVYKDVCVWLADDLTLRGPDRVAGRAHLDADGVAVAQGKAIWVIKGANTTVEDIEFSGASCVDKNGAGIRQEGDGLTVRRSWFHDNEDGILGGGSAASDVVVEHCEFERNGYGDGLSHNIYIGGIRSFTLRYCYMHHARIGHEVKSRAATNYILYNRISNEDGDASRNIDLPNAGTAYLVGNVIHQGVNTDNSTMFGFGAEGGTGTAWVVNNTFVNERSLGTAVYVYNGCAVVLKDNLFHGTTTIVTVSGTGAYSGDHNRVPVGAAGAAGLTASVIGGDPSFADEAAFDYSLGEDSVCRDAGTAPGSAGGFDLTPVKQYVHPASFEPRPAEGPPDIGAYEYAPPGSGPNGGGRTDRGGCEGGGGGSAASLLVTFAVIVSLSPRSH